MEFNPAFKGLNNTLKEKGLHGQSLLTTVLSNYVLSTREIIITIIIIILRK